MNTKKMTNKEIAQKLLELAKELDPETLATPEFWEIKIEKGMTIEGVLAECKKLFPVWRWTDDNLDQIINSDRTSKKAYTVKVKENVEADEELKNLSADDLKEKGIKGITLLERLVLEIQYFKETGKHLDIDNVTLCSGSRRSDGSVPDVYWNRNDSSVRVLWCNSGLRDGNLRSRRIV
jgi:hypothetical protein